MAEGVVAIVIEGIKFGNFLFQQAKFLSGVSDQVELAQIELLLMQGFLKDADARKGDDEVVRIWVNIIRDTAYHLEDVIESFVLKVASKRKGSEKIILNRFACNILNQGGVVDVYKIGSEIENITSRLSRLRLSMQSYNIREEPRGSGGETSIQRQRADQRQTYAHEIERDIVGLEEDAEFLVGKLVEEEKSVSIWGMGGLGKTTLAKKVYHHDKVKRYFDCFAWVCISQQCQQNDDVWKDIFSKLTSATSEEKKIHKNMENKEIAEKRSANQKETQMEKQSSMRKEKENFANMRDISGELYKIQKERKCLVVLDDIWTIRQWNSLKAGFPVNEETGSRILITTRNKEVTLHDGYIHEGRLLNEQESWKLFEKIAISEREDDRGSEIHAKKVDLGKQMVQHCAGLPLAITVLAGVLSKKETVGEWDKVQGDVNAYIRRGTDLEREYKGQEYQGVSWVLKLSYDDLPFRLKLCFLYLAHFPEDYEIPVKRLTQLWMAEGFISSTSQRHGSVESMEDVSYNCVIELVERCMVQVGKYGSTKKIKTCCLHDLMRELCVSMAKEENFLHIVKSTDNMATEVAPIGKVRRLAIDVNRFEVVNKLGPTTDNHLRSLLCFSFADIDKKILCSFVKDLKFLRILKIEDVEEEVTVELPSAIGNLVHLRFVSIKGCNVKRLPSSMAKLVSLQTLDLRCYLSEWKKIPNVIGKMEQLRHLYLPFYRKRIRGKLKLDWLPNLQTLVNVRSSDCDLEDLAKLKNLRKLFVDVSWSLKSLEVGEMLKSTFSGLQSLSVTTSSDEGVIVRDIVLSCRNLYKLQLFGPITELPGEVRIWTEKLTKITLISTRLKDDQIEILEKLPNLRMLSLLWNGVFGTLNCSRGGFPHLEFLSLWSLTELKEWTVEEGAMPGLCTLHIDYCKELRQVADGQKYITTLKELTIKGMRSEFCNKLREGGDDFYKIQHVPSVLLEPDDA